MLCTPLHWPWSRPLFSNCRRHYITTRLVGYKSNVMVFEASLMVYKSGLIVYESTEQVEQVQRPEGPLQ